MRFLKTLLFVLPAMPCFAQEPVPTAEGAQVFVTYALQSDARMHNFSRMAEKWGVIRHMDANDRVRLVSVGPFPISGVTSSDTCTTKFKSYYISDQHNDAPILDAQPSDFVIPWSYVFKVVRAGSVVTVGFFDSGTRIVFGSENMAERYTNAANFLTQHCATLPETGF